MFKSLIALFFLFALTSASLGISPYFGFGKYFGYPAWESTHIIKTPELRGAYGQLGVGSGYGNAGLDNVDYQKEYQKVIEYPKMYEKELKHVEINSNPAAALWKYGGPEKVVLASGVVTSPMQAGIFNSPLTRRIITSPMAAGIVNTPFGPEVVASPMHSGLFNPLTTEIIASPMHGGLFNNPLAQRIITTPMGAGIVNTPLGAELINSPLAVGQVGSMPYLSSRLLSTPFAAGSHSVIVAK
uniref:Uncharacterized protein n=1 Tax=Arion vulgaris TaxID=1028688 RepID=A0A0B6Y9F6_9EUPU